MSPPPCTQVYAAVALFCVLLLAGAGAFLRRRLPVPAPPLPVISASAPAKAEVTPTALVPSKEIPVTPVPDRPPVVVHVVGCVRQPVSTPSRKEPAFTMPLSARAARKRAPIWAINLAACLRDGVQITCRAGAFSRRREHPPRAVAFAARGRRLACPGADLPEPLPPPGRAHAPERHEPAPASPRPRMARRRPRRNAPPRSAILGGPGQHQHRRCRRATAPPTRRTGDCPADPGYGRRTALPLGDQPWRSAASVTSTGQAARSRRVVGPLRFGPLRGGEEGSRGEGDAMGQQIGGNTPPATSIRGASHTPLPGKVERGEGIDTIKRGMPAEETAVRQASGAANRQVAGRIGCSDGGGDRYRYAPGAARGRRRTAAVARGL